jgi:predicted O-methyltransferase YrrM
MLFHGLVEDEANYENQSRSVRGLIRKLLAFHQNLLENEDYTTSIFDIGDGMSVSVKK